MLHASLALCRNVIGSECTGEVTPRVRESVALACAMLNGGNSTVQQVQVSVWCPHSLKQTMLSYLKSQRAFRFFTVLHKLIGMLACRECLTSTSAQRTAWCPIWTSCFACSNCASPCWSAS